MVNMDDLTGSCFADADELTASFVGDIVDWGLSGEEAAKWGLYFIKAREKVPEHGVEPFIKLLRIIIRNRLSS